MNIELEWKKKLTETIILLLTEHSYSFCTCNMLALHFLYRNLYILINQRVYCEILNENTKTKTKYDCPTRLCPFY